MKNVIHKIFSNEIDSEVHNDFVKFSKGLFQNRYLIEAKKQKDKFSIKTSAEFANFLVRKCLEKTSGNIRIKGAVISTLSLREEKGYLFSPEEKIKQFMGIKQIVVDEELNPKEVIEVMNKYPRAFYALSFSTKDYELKIKAKAPKSGKPGKKGDEEPKAEFCSLKTFDKEIINDLLFDLDDFREVKINHTIVIEKIEIPKDETNPVKMRENSIREGKIIRKIDVDGKKKEEEFYLRV